MRALPKILAISLTALALVTCDKGTPTAPQGAKLTVTASPLQITANGTSTVTVTALRSSGSPVNPGTEIHLDTTLGSVPDVITTDERGIAQGQLRGTGTAGTAKVSARSGIADVATVEVKIGSKVDKITLQATPTSIDIGTTSTVNLLAVVRDDLGQALPGANVVFGAEAGVLTSRGAIVITNQRGEASDRLTVSPTDAATVASGTLTVTAQVSGGGGSASATSDISIRVPPVANFDFAISLRSVSFSDHSTGTPTSWRWDFGDGTTSAAQNPTHVYPGAGSFDVTLRVTNAFGEDELTQTVTVQ